jgi:hypothetical protein
VFPFSEEDFRMVAIGVVVLEFIRVTVSALVKKCKNDKEEVLVECAWDIGPAGIWVISILFQPNTITDVLSIGVLDKLYNRPFPIIGMSCILFIFNQPQLALYTRK